MAHLIDKSALVAEMNKLKNISLEYGYTTEQRIVADVGKDLTLKGLLDYIDTLEVSNDAFIEKACEYLMEYEFNDSPTIADRRKRVDEFRNYMKGE